MLRLVLVMWVLCIECLWMLIACFFFFFQAEDGIRDDLVTGVQTCALPIYPGFACPGPTRAVRPRWQAPWQHGPALFLSRFLSHAPVAPPMSLFSLLGAVEIGLIFSLVALGVFISFRLLRFPDLTVDGSFPVGGAVCAILISTGTNPWLATLAGTAAGAVAGLITGWLNVRLKIMDLLASILMMIGLYSVNLRIMGGPNVPLINETTLFTLLQPDSVADYVMRPVILFVIVVIAKLGLDWLFATERGLAIRATGSNARMARSQGVNTGAMILLGMAISNGLVGLAGALFVQTQGGSDISMGIGTIVIGLAEIGRAHV